MRKFRTPYRYISKKGGSFYDIVCEEVLEAIKTLTASLFGTGLSDATVPETMASQAARASRRALNVALIGFAVLAGLLALETAIAERMLENAAGRESAARIAVEQILYADEKLTMSANMAVATGEETWIDRYERALPEIDRPIALATSLASPLVAARFDAETRASNDALVSFERRAFEYVRKGQPELGKKILDGSDYDRHKTILAKGGSRFAEALVLELQVEIQEIKTWVTVVRTVSAALGILVIGFFVRRWLARAECAQAANENMLQRLAWSDPLTGLANRAAFEKELAKRTQDPSINKTMYGLRTVDNMEPSTPTHALISFDLNGFKRVNDRHGHAAGDTVLREAGRRLQASLPTAFVSRIGGDEFAVLDRLDGTLLTGLTSKVRVALSEMNEPIKVGVSDLSVSACAGIAAIFSQVEPQEVRRGADLALYRAKEVGSGANGSAKVQLFTEEMDAEHREELLADDRVCEALRNDEFKAFFQPIVDLESSEPVCVEALARWHQDAGQTFPPAYFLPRLERLGRTSDLTWLIMADALRTAVTWERPLPVSVNVPPAQLSIEFADRTLRLLKSIGLPTDRLYIEILETDFIEDGTLATECLIKLRAAGVRVALDDFGVGSSSLGQLARVTVDRVKIDRSFVAGIGAPCSDEAEAVKSTGKAVTRAAIELAAAFGLEAIAEGIETEEDSAALRAMGCKLGQGYLYARPMDSADIFAYLRREYVKSRGGSAKLKVITTG